MARTMLLAMMATTACGNAHHKHQDIHNKCSVDVHGNTKGVYDIKTVFKYAYKGELIDDAALCLGLANGTIHWKDDFPPHPDCKELDASLTSVASISHSTDILPVGFVPFEKPGSYPVGESVGPWESVSADTSGFNLQNHNTDRDFPDGKVPCSEFPSAYGAVSVPWVDLGGWSGIQYARVSANVVSHVSSPDPGQEGCRSSISGQITYCSYACPAGFQKSQWPHTQGSDSYAVSVGGLECGSDGMLYLTNPDLSSKLCIRGADNLTITNKLEKGTAVCRTDYPGTEAETVPVFIDSGQKVALTCPDSAIYYKHLGKPTTAHYYVNDDGIAVDTACQWGKDDSNLGKSYGNWAPIILGVGQDESGSTWLSIVSSCQNNPNVCNDLSFSIELEGDFGDSSCYYTQYDGKGYWCQQGFLVDFKPGTSNCKTKDTDAVPGCTVQLKNGKASYNFVPTSNQFGTM